jgi:hypothetical protein
VPAQHVDGLPGHGHGHRAAGAVGLRLGELQPAADALHGPPNGRHAGLSN